jgi:hypothetical protein
VGKRRKRKNGNRGNTGILEVLLPLPPQAMMEYDWTPSPITPGHLQKLVKKEL